MNNRDLLVKRDKFQIKVEVAEDETTTITYTIPKKGDDVFNPNDYSHLITHIMELCMKKNDGKYDIFINGVQEQKRYEVSVES